MSFQFFGYYSEAIATADEAIIICEKNGFLAMMGSALLTRGASYFISANKNRD